MVANTKTPPHRCCLRRGAKHLNMIGICDAWKVYWSMMHSIVEITALFCSIYFYIHHIWIIIKFNYDMMDVGMYVSQTYVICILLTWIICETHIWSEMQSNSNLTSSFSSWYAWWKDIAYSVVVVVCSPLMPEQLSRQVWVTLFVFICEKCLLCFTLIVLS